MTAGVVSFASHVEMDSSLRITGMRNLLLWISAMVAFAWQVTIEHETTGVRVRGEIQIS